MKRTLLLLILPLLLTSCSNPDTSGGVTLSRGGGDDANEFPNGSCEGQHENTPDLNTGCGWKYGDSLRYYIKPGANLSSARITYDELLGANLRGANLTYSSLRYLRMNGADLSGANLTYADLGAARLIGANLDGAVLHFTDMGTIDLHGATLREASLVDVDLRLADLRGADFSGAKLTGVRTERRFPTICPNGITYGTAGHDCPF